MEIVSLGPNQLTTKTAGDRIKIKTAIKKMRKELMTKVCYSAFFANFVQQTNK